MKNYEVKMTMSSVQADIVQRALDLYVRLGLGQVEETANVLNMLHDVERPDDLREVMKAVKNEYLALGGGMSFGIGNRRVEDTVHVAYDMEKGIQKVLATTEKHGGHSVWHSGNCLKYGSEPFATFSTIVDGVETPVPTKG